EQAGLPSSECERDQPDIERRLRIVVIDRSHERGADPVVVMEHLPRGDGVQRLIPLGDNFAADAVREVERREAENRGGEHTIAPLQEGTCWTVHPSGPKRLFGRRARRNRTRGRNFYIVRATRRPSVARKEPAPAGRQ